MKLPQCVEIPEREFERLVLAERPYLIRIVTQIVRASDAEDVCQDALIHALHARKQFRYGSNLRGWFLRIARNCAYDALRKRAREMRAQVNLTMHDRVPNPTATLEIERTFDLMPRHLAETLAMFLWGYTYREIAALLGIPLGTVMSRIHRARRRIATLGLSGAYFFLAELTQLGYTKPQSEGPIV